MAKLPSKEVAQTAALGVFALTGAVLIGAAPVAGVIALGTAHIVLFTDVNDPDPAPLIQDPPEVQGPANPGQKTLAPSQHHRSHHRAPTST